MGFTDFLKKAFPFLSTAASFGGPLGTMAAAAVGKALGVDKIEGTEKGIADAIANAMASPEQRAALLKAEQDFQVQMATLNVNSTEELERIAASDRASARDREIKVRDHLPAVLALATTIGFFGTLLLVMLHGVKESARDLTNIMIGTLGTAWVAVITYYFGSSAGSQKKDELLAAKGN